MRKAADLIKKQLVQVDTGNIVGHVADLLIDPEAGRLAAVVVTSGRWRETTVIPWDQIVVSTGDVVLVAAGVEPQLASAVPPLQALLERNIHLSGTPVLTEKGSRVGTVGELLIDAAGSVVAYTINRGFLGSERLFLGAEGVVSTGSDALLVREESLRDSMEPAAEGARAEELKHAIVLPLTGTRLVVTGDGAALETPAEAHAHTHAEPTPEPTDSPPAEAELPLDFAPPATGATVHLSGAEVDAILRGEQPVPAAPVAPAGKNPFKLSGADVDAILRGQRPVPEAPLSAADQPSPEHPHPAPPAAADGQESAASENKEH